MELITLSDCEDENLENEKISDHPDILLDHFTTLFGSEIHLFCEDKKKKKKSEESCWSIASLDENKIIDICKSEKKGKTFIDYLKKYFVRVYPKGTRIDSSNYDPMPSFALGC